MKLEYKIVDVTDKVITIQITKQEAKRGCGKVFASSNGILFRSDIYPDYSLEYSGVGKVLYLQGTDDRATDDIKIPLANWSQFYIAIKEYNDFVPPKKHTIVIDGKTIELSEESFNALKNSLKE